jgi:mono/diheme cytochrome c family protein
MNHYRLVFALLSLVLLSACSFSLAEDVTPPPGAELPPSMPTRAPINGPLYPLAPLSPADGAPVYAEKCAPCHGLTGQGDGPQAGQLPNPPAPLGSPELARQATPAEWYTVVTQGDLDRFMPPFASLSEGQRWDVVAYAFTLSSPPDTVAQGQELYQANCAGCHGATGQGNGPEAAGLSAPPTDFADQELMASRSAEQLFEAISAGLGPDMPAYADQLDEAQRWALTAFLRSLTFASVAEIAGAEGTPAPEPLLTPGAGEAAPASGTAVAAAPTSRTGPVTGRLVNPAGSELPANLTVTLHGFDDMQEAFTASGAVQPDGTFTFEEVELPPGRVFLASVEYDQAVYTSDIFVVESDMAAVDLPIPIYGTTSDRAALAIDRLHMFIDYAEPDTLRVVEVYVISNQGDRTVVAGREGEPVISFEVPQGATNLQFEGGSLGERYVETGAGVGDTAPIRPGLGEHQVVFAYDLPYGRNLDLIRKPDLPVNAVVILVPDNGLKLKGDLLVDEGARSMQGSTYRVYSSGRLEPGTDLALTVSGRPRGSAGLLTGSGSSLMIGLGAFGLALIAAGVWLYSRSRTSASAPAGAQEEELPAEDDLAEDPDLLMDAILALDDQYQAGKLPEEAYRQRRADLKARLRELLGSGPKTG